MEQIRQHSEPSLVVLNIDRFGIDLEDRVFQLKSQYPQHRFILTSDRGYDLSNAEIDLFNHLKVLRRPFTGYRLELILADLPEAPEPSGMVQPSRGKVRLPIRVKITAPYILLALVLAVAAVFVVSRLVFDSIEERFLNQLYETGKISAEWMVREENRMLETLRLLANTTDLAAAIQDGDAEKLRLLAYPIAVNAQIEAVDILDQKGISQLSMVHQKGGRVEEYLFSRGAIDFANLDFVNRVLRGQQDSLGDKFGGLVRIAKGEYFYIAGPVYDHNGKLIGAILVGQSLERLVRGMREATLAQVTIYDFDGAPLASTFLDSQPLEVSTVAGILQQQDGFSFRRDISVVDIDYSEILAAWEFRSDDDLGELGVALPQNFFIRLNRSAGWQIVIVVTVIFLLVILSGVLVAESITRPLLQVVQASAEVARGNLRVKVDSGSNDEVHTLEKTFNYMISELDRSNFELLEAYNSSLEGWSKALDLRDHGTENHSQRVVELTVHIARKLGVKEADLIHIRRGALLHDIGKMGVPDRILLKPGKLSAEEWEIMRKHPVYAYEMLSPIRHLRQAIDIPYCHHERWDGNGYPNGLKGEEIPLAARIFAVVDAWDALTSDRPYRKALSWSEAMEIIRSESGTHFDPQIVDLLEQSLAEVEMIPMTVPDGNQPEREAEEAIAA